MILIDCGASHSFVSQQMVEEMGISVQDTPAFWVEVGDGHKVKSEGICKGLVVRLQQMEFSHDYYIFVLKGPNIVLRLEISWLISRNWC